MKERYSGFARDCPCKQGFSRAGCPGENHALGNPRADIQKFFRTAEKVYDFFQFFFSSLKPGYIFEGHPIVLVGRVSDARLGLAERKRLHARASDLAG